MISALLLVCCASTDFILYMQCYHIDAKDCNVYHIKIALKFAADAINRVPTSQAINCPLDHYKSITSIWHPSSYSFLRNCSKVRVRDCHAKSPTCKWVSREVC